VAELPAPRQAGDGGLVTIACRTFVELVTEHLEGTLPESVEQAIAAHLELCEPCRIYLEQMRATATALRALPTPTLPPPARRRLLEVFAALHGGEDAHARG
jgi:predicted anti-sigma-YlaC factor YlaD